MRGNTSTKMCIIYGGDDGGVGVIVRVNCSPLQTPKAAGSPTAHKTGTSHLFIWLNVIAPPLIKFRFQWPIPKGHAATMTGLLFMVLASM